RRAGRADRAEHSLRHELAVLDSGEQLTNALVAAERADDLYKWPEGDAVAVRETAARECLGFAAHLAAELGSESRLPDPGGAEDGDHPARASRNGARKRVAKRAHLIAATHEPRIEAAR